MAIVPKPTATRIAFYAGRLDALEANAAALGIDAETIALLGAQVRAAKEASMRQRLAQQEARCATAALNVAMKAMMRTGVTVIQRVRNKAVANRDPSLYGLALLPPLSKRSPLAAPGTPYRLQTALDAIGQLTLTWRCDNPKGAENTIYHVARSTGDIDALTLIGTAGAKRFVDSTIPAGATKLLYEIHAERSTNKGGAQRFSVYFGSNQTISKVGDGLPHQSRRAA